MAFKSRKDYVWLKGNKNWFDLEYLLFLFSSRSWDFRFGESLKIMMREKIYEKLYISWWIRSIRSARIDRMLWEQLSVPSLISKRQPLRNLLLFLGQLYQSLCFLALFAVNTLFASVRPKKFYEISRSLLGRAYPRRQYLIPILLGGLFTWVICQNTMFESEILVLSETSVVVTF